MWKLSPGELLPLKGRGEPFAHFVDRLIRAEAAKGWLPQSEVWTQLRLTIKDGGVDTQVTRVIPRDQSGWFGGPTCWQFKAVEAKAINDQKYKKKKNSLQEEINKPYARQLIARGYAYRFCLLGDLSPPKLKNWEEQLRTEVARIRSDAPDPRVIHGGDLLPWAQRFPAVVAALRGLTQEILHWEAWQKNCRAVTRVYVRNPQWEDVRGRILQHIDFNTACVGGRPCLLIGGAAGVGKTRLVFETLRESEASPGLVVYAWDEQEARRVATAVANNPDQTVIIVADECSHETRFALNEHLRGHGDRIRVIGLANSGPRRSADAWLDRESIGDTVHVILEENFPRVPEVRRRQYAEVSRGFVRLAADMCQHDKELAGGEMATLAKRVEEYVRHRLGDHLALVSLLALFQKVGFREEVQAEVEILCTISTRSRRDFLDAVSAVRESPGFVVQAGRYWYVTPEIVTEVLFAEGWQRWVEPNPAVFLTDLPAHLQQHLIERAGRFGGEEVRRQIASFFRGWFDELTTRDLAHPRRTSLASAILQARPEEHLPKLRDIIDRAGAGDLMRIRGDWNGTEWGPRRTLVWLLENLVAFPDLFEDCEACLFRLAVHETEHQIGNSATEIWRNLFCVDRSGTAAPFHQRLESLKNRLRSQELPEAKLAFRGLSQIFEGSSGQIIGPPEIAGRLRPPDWQPASADEQRACYLEAIELCGEHMAVGDADRRSLAFDVLVNHIGFLLEGGFLDEISRVLTPHALREDEARQLAKAVDDFLGYRSRIRRNRGNEQAVRYPEVGRWADSFRPSDFGGKLRSVCARNPWDQRFGDDPGNQRDETDELAAEIRWDPSLLAPHLDWLAGHEARSAERLGFAIGRIDEEFACGRMIFKQAIRWNSAPLLGGYVRGLVFAERSPTEEILRLMAELEATHPETAVDILIRGGDRFDALNRVIHLVESRAVSPVFLAAFAMGIGRRDLSVEEVGRLLRAFVAAAVAADADAVRAGVEFLATVLLSEERRSQRRCLDAEGVRSQAWRLIECALPYVENQLSHEWSEIVEQLAGYDLSRAASLLGQALLSESLDVESRAQDQLMERAAENPGAVMEGLGQALLDPTRGWRLQVRVARDLVARLPTPIVLSWVRKHGVDAARAIARHLPRPSRDEEGQPVVPEMLDIILREYNDDQVLDNFTAGVHAGESWWGDGSQQFRREAEDASRFLKHRNRRIRQWARQEIDQRTSMAEWEERKYAERALP